MEPSASCVWLGLLLPSQVPREEHLRGYAREGPQTNFMVSQVGQLVCVRVKWQGWGDSIS